MASHFKQAAKNSNQHSHRTEPTQPKGQAMSRRGFIRNVAAGTAALSAGLGSAKAIRAKGKEQGLITLDAMLVTYFSASIGGTDLPRWSLKGEYSQTIALNLLEFPDVQMFPKVTQQDNRIFAGHRVWQSLSTQINGGLVMQHKGFANTSFSIGAEGVAHTGEDTPFFCILRPRLRVTAKGNNLRFAFTDEPEETSGGAIFFPTIREIKDGSLLDLISQETMNSWLPHYITDRQSLIRPRFKLREDTGSISSGVGVPVNLTADGDQRFSAEKTARSKARIIRQTGFESEELKQMFAIGNHLEITHTSVQEIESENVVRMNTTLTRAVGGKSEIYWDSLFKTFTIIDAE